MAKERRQLSEQQKLQIIQEVEINGLLPFFASMSYLNRYFTSGNVPLIVRGLLVCPINTLRLILKNDV